MKSLIVNYLSPIGGIAIEDITERRRVEIELEEAAERVPQNEVIREAPLQLDSDSENHVDELKKQAYFA
ncbi:Uncharacterised protein [uncultured archaeon]|nr:Uncharacterised protein [uncultured archaeon]